MFNTTDNENRKPGTGAIATNPNPEVSPKQPRRRFTASYKLKILEELDRCTVVGEKGAILRREGLYSSQISDWRQQRDAGAVTVIPPKIKGPQK